MSPYLIRHAEDPVDWYPWAEEPFRRAVQEDKPVFLSIGYLACHWCHVMARESFDDENVAKILNESFVCIKVDREERPDIDAVYMATCQLMTGSGGWPLTIVLTPWKKPIFAATYIPRDTRFGVVGLLDLLPRIATLWKDRKEDLLLSSEFITNLLSQQGNLETDAGKVLEDPSDVTFGILDRNFDPINGGFGSAPKFPSPHILMFLLRYWKRTGSVRALTMVTKTLAGIAAGGITDQVGGGIHRYSTDDTWRIPHFEKMLYDQALYVLAATETAQATGSAWCRSSAEETITYVLRDLAAPEGGFFSAEDADSEGREGVYYLWGADELTSLLGSDAAAVARSVFHIARDRILPDPHGFEGNILYRALPGGENDDRYGQDKDGLESRIKAIRATLLEARTRRVHPLRDEKILSGWNGLMIAALARAGWAFSTPAYVAAAVRAAEFILSRMRMEDGGLYRRMFHGAAGIPGFAEDYAGVACGLTELYEATFQDRYLAAASELTDYLIAHFEDLNSGGFFTIPDNREAILVRQKEMYDGAVPSPNSLALYNLRRLFRLTGIIRFDAAADRMVQTFSAEVNRMPEAYTFYLCGVGLSGGDSQEVVIAGPEGRDDTEQMIRVCREGFRPDLLVRLYTTGNEKTIPCSREDPEPCLYGSVGGRATAYICTGKKCSAPVTDPNELVRQLNRKTRI